MLHNMTDSFTRNTLEAQCRGAISLVSLYFSIDLGQVYTRSDSHIFDILRKVLHQLSSVDQRLLVLDTIEAQEEIMKAIYDIETIPLVCGDCLHVDERLDSQEKARLLVQGISGAVAIASLLSDLHAPVICGMLYAEISHFCDIGQPSHIRETVERSHLFNDCLMTSQILDLIMEASHGGGANNIVKTNCVSFSDYNVDVFGSEYERPSRNMGLPWGFSFMTLN